MLQIILSRSTTSLKAYTHTPATNTQLSCKVCEYFGVRWLLPDMKPLNSDDNWTKEETDYLFGLVQEYDQRFYVISDRYAFPGGPPRAIEVG